MLALKGVLAEDNIFIDHDKFLLAALTRACKLKNDRVNTRLPIKKGMLKIILKETLNLFLSQQPYLAHMYSALFATAYFGLLRVGEITAGLHPIMVKDVHIARKKIRCYLFLGHQKLMANMPYCSQSK